MISVNLPNLFLLKFENFQVDLKNPSCLGVDLSFTFYLPGSAGKSSFDKMRVWFDMEQWQCELGRIERGKFSEVKIHDVSENITILFSLNGLRIGASIKVDRPIDTTGHVTAAYAKKTEFDNVNRFSHFMRSVTEEYTFLR